MTIEWIQITGQNLQNKETNYILVTIYFSYSSRCISIFIFFVDRDIGCMKGSDDWKSPCFSCTMRRGPTHVHSWRAISAMF